MVKIKNKIIIGLFIFIFITTFVSADLIIENNQNIQINKTYEQDTYFDITIRNNGNFDFFNVTFENNDFISIVKIPKISSNEILNSTVRVFSNTPIINKEIKLKGFYDALIGSSNETYEVDVDYDNGLDKCSFSVIKGDSIKWNNLETYDIKLRNANTLEDIQILSGNSSFEMQLDNPMEFSYYFTRYGFQFTNTCQINVLDDHGLINNPEYDGSLILNLNLSYPSTELQLTILETNYSISFLNGQDGLLSLKNIGNETAKDVHLSGDWFSFSENNFDLIPGYSKNVGYTISPIGKVFSTNETNKTHIIPINITGNFLEISKDFNIFLEYAEVTNQLQGNESIDFLEWIREHYPELLEPKIVYRYMDNNSKLFNVTLSQEQLNGLWDAQFSYMDIQDEYQKFQKEMQENITSNLNKMTESVFSLDSRINTLEENLLKNKDLNTVLILILSMILICGGLGYFTIIKLRQIKKKEMNRL